MFSVFCLFVSKMAEVKEMGYKIHTCTHMHTHWDAQDGALTLPQGFHAARGYSLGREEEMKVIKDR